MTLVRQFFQDFYSLRLPYIMMKYRTNAVHLQRFVRSYVLITRARVSVLLLKWLQVESQMRSTLIPCLLQAVEREEELKQNQRESAEGLKWKVGESSPTNSQPLVESSLRWCSFSPTCRKSE